jgi:hypothetical protein
MSFYAKPMVPRVTFLCTCGAKERGLVQKSRGRYCAGCVPEYLIWAESYPARRSNGTLWGANRYSGIVAVQDGVFAVTGPMKDLATSNKWQFGTLCLYERPDFIFSSGSNKRTAD